MLDVEVIVFDIMFYHFVYQRPFVSNWFCPKWYLYQTGTVT